MSEGLVTSRKESQLNRRPNTGSESLLLLGPRLLFLLRSSFYCSRDFLTRSGVIGQKAASLAQNLFTSLEASVMVRSILNCTRDHAIGPKVS